jgi:hypothetical protein
MTEGIRDWRIRDTDADWESDWEGSERFHVRCFRALPTQEKLEAVEEMCRFVETYLGGASRRNAANHVGLALLPQNGAEAPQSFGRRDDAAVEVSSAPRFPAG